MLSNFFLLFTGFINFFNTIIMPLILIVSLVWVINLGSLYKINLNTTNCLVFLSKLEEVNVNIPYVIRTFYKKVLENNYYLITSLFSISFWTENSACKKMKENSINLTLLISVVRRLTMFYSIWLFYIGSKTWLNLKSDSLIYNNIFELRGSSTYNNNKSELINSDLNINSPINQKIWDNVIYYGPEEVKTDAIMGSDALNTPFIALTGFISPIAILSNWSTIIGVTVYYFIMMILLELFLMIVFLINDLILFYVLFESTLPLLFCIIGFFGALQKYRAGYYLFLYTLVGSLYMLISFVKIGGDQANTYFVSTSFEQTFVSMQSLIWCGLFFSFAVKTPIIPFHIWLPLAHADANVSGSILLAAVVLKLAIYGFIRILIGIFSVASLLFWPLVSSLATSSVLFSSFTTIRQIDLKVLIAYSSVAHMGTTVLGGFSNEIIGISGSILFSLAHAGASSGLFFIVGAILYDRCGSRIINYYKGLTNILPIFAGLFLLFTFANMGVPLTGNFIGELLSLLGAYQQNIIITSIAATSVILSAVYSIYMYNRITGGSMSPYIHTIPDIFRKEFFVLLPLLFFIFILGIYPYFITSEIEFGLSSYLLISISPIILEHSNKFKQNEKYENITNKNIFIGNNIWITNKYNKLLSSMPIFGIIIPSNWNLDFTINLLYNNINKIKFLILFLLLVFIWRKIKHNFLIWWIQYNINNQYRNNKLLSFSYLRLTFISIMSLFTLLSYIYNILSININILSDIFNSIILNFSIIHNYIIEYYCEYYMKDYMFTYYSLTDTHSKLNFKNKEEIFDNIYYNKVNRKNYTDIEDEYNSDSNEYETNINSSDEERNSLDSNPQTDSTLPTSEENYNQNTNENQEENIDNTLVENSIEQNESEENNLKRKSEELEEDDIYTSSKYTISKTKLEPIEESNNEYNDDMDEITDNIKNLNSNKTKFNPYSIESESEYSEKENDNKEIKEKKSNEKLILLNQKEEIEKLNNTIQEYRNDIRNIRQNTPDYKNDPGIKEEILELRKTLNEKIETRNKNVDTFKEASLTYNLKFHIDKFELEGNDKNIAQLANKKPKTE